MTQFLRLMALALSLAPLVVAAQSDVLNTRISGRLEQVTQMLKAASAGNADGVSDAKTEIEELPYPARGDRRAARRLNTSGLDKFKAEQIPASLADFERAWNIDPSDQEITNNYGYVLYRSGRLAEAEKLLRYTLALAPARSTAWANLAEVFGSQGDTDRTTAAFVVAHRYSRNPDTTKQYIEKFANTSETVGLKKGAQGALVKLFPQQQAAVASALAMTAAEKKTMQSSEAVSVATRPTTSTTIQTTNTSSKVVTAIADPMLPFVQRLPDTESVVSLYLAARSGNDASREALLRLAFAGNARAQNAVGNLYNLGLGVESNHELANTWYRKSATTGFPLAQVALAWNLQHGIGGRQDLALAFDSYRKAAEQGHPFGMHNLAVMYARGQGVAIDRIAALQWFIRSADAGVARGAHNAGLMLERGDGAPIDVSLAFAYQLSAANAGFPQAQLKVAQNYEYGRGVSLDRSLAINWYKKAAFQGIEAAQEALKRLGVTDF